MSRRPHAALLALVPLVAALIVGFTASTAYAQHEGQLELCGNDGHSGTCLYRYNYDSNFHNDYVDDCRIKCGRNFGDMISSVDNDTDNWWKLYQDKNYGGYVMCLRPRGYDGDLGNNGSAGFMEDEISSVKEQGTARPKGCDYVFG